MDKDNTLFLSDVDGVLTNRRAEPSGEAIRLLAECGRRHLVHLVTGRGAGWLTREILHALSGHFGHSESVWLEAWGPHCAEYGGILVHFDGAVWKKGLNGNFTAVPAAVREDIRRRAQDIPGVFFDEDKQVMVSLEARHALAEKEPELVRQGLEKARALLEEYGKDGCEVRNTTYATDLVVCGKDGRWMDKEYGADFILEHAGFIPDYVHVLGDAPSDLGLADAVAKRDIPYTFHFVGEEKSLSTLSFDKLRAYPLKFTREKYDRGAVEILSSLCHK